MNETQLLLSRILIQRNVPQEIIAIEEGKEKTTRVQKQEGSEGWVKQSWPIFTLGNKFCILESQRI